MTNDSILRGTASEHTPPHPEPNCQPPTDGGLLSDPKLKAAFAKLDDFVGNCMGSAFYAAKDVRDELFAALNTRANPPTEPVAYRWRTRNGMSKEWKFQTEFSPALMENCIEFEPLYAIPTPEGGEVDNVKSACTVKTKSTDEGD